MSGKVSDVQLEVGSLESPAPFDVTARAKMETEICKKLDMRIMPILTLIFLFAYIDRSNVGNARILGLSTDLDLGGYRFNTMLSAFYVTYIIFEIPSNIFCKRFGPKWLAFLSFGFGIITICSSTVGSYEGLIAARVFLGMLEAGIMPGIVYTLSCFYRRHELGKRVGFYASVAPLSGAFGGLLATGLSKIPPWGMIHTWRNIFFFEGFVSIALGIIAYLILPTSPGTASFLTVEERQVATSRINDEIQSRGPEKFEWSHVRMAIFNLNTTLMAIIGFCTVITMASMSLFLPSILNAMGYNSIQSQLMSVPPYAWATLVCLTVSQLSDRTKIRGWWLLAIMHGTVLGFILLIAVDITGVKYFAVYLCLTGAFTASSMTAAWVVDNSAGYVVRAVSVGYVVMVANFGSMLATWTYLKPDAPRYIKGHAINLGAGILCCILIFFSILYLKWENRQRDKGQRDWRLTGLTDDEQIALGHKHPSFRFTP